MDKEAMKAHIKKWRDLRFNDYTLERLGPALDDRMAWATTARVAFEICSNSS